ncbi:MAG: hypothetical protein ACKOE6_07325 [Flammeovirgaceae bacterium]
MKPIDFKTSAYFPGIFIFLGVILVFIGLLVLGTTIIGGLAVLLVSFTIFTTHYRLTVDLDSKSYYDYLWILGIKTGERGTFENIEYVFIKKSRESQTMNSRASTTTIQKEVFDGYLKFSENAKIHLLTKDRKEDLMVEMKVVASKLGTKVVDFSEGTS